MTLSEKLKLLRREKKLTRQAAAKEAGMSVVTYSAYEDGKRLPKRNPENYDKLAAVFGCSPELLKDDTQEIAAASPEKPVRAGAKRPGRKPKAAPAPIRMELQFGEGSVDMDAVAARARELDSAVTALYIKPEENMVYYVAGENSGSFTLF